MCSAGRNSNPSTPIAVKTATILLPGRPGNTTAIICAGQRAVKRPDGRRTTAAGYSPSIKHSDLRTLPATMRHRHVEPIRLRDEQAGPSASSCRDPGHPLEVIAIRTPQDIDEAITADHIQALPLDVIEHVVGISDNLHR